MRFSYLLPILGCVSAIAGSQLEIKKFRFNQHQSPHFDRLVFEFGAKGLHGAPGLRVLPKGKETLVSIDKVSIVGAIPETNINDSYGKNAKYLGPVSFNTDSHDGFSIRVFTKQENTKVEAFWLESPSRLIIDAFPASSDRAQGPHVLHAKRNVATGGKKARHGHGGNKEGVYCFNSAAQVKAALTYENGDHFKGIPMTVDGAPGQTSPVVDNIVCYPKSAQVMPKVSFSNGEGPARVEASVAVPVEAPTVEVVKPKSLLPPSSGWVPPTSPKLPPTSGWVPPTNSNGDREALLNKEADDVMAQEEPRKTASQDNSWEDNFNKNNPPPTLGKTLLPPNGGGGAGARVKPQLASPGSLLPPLR